MKDMSLQQYICRDLTQLRQHYTVLPVMPPITQLTSVLDTEITCTHCRGEKWVGVVAQSEGISRIYCPNCLGTGKMPSRTSEEAWQIKHGERQ